MMFTVLVWITALSWVGVSAITLGTSCWWWRWWGLKVSSLSEAEVSGLTVFCSASAIGLGIVGTANFHCVILIIHGIQHGWWSILPVGPTDIIIVGGKITALSWVGIYNTANTTLFLDWFWFWSWCHRATTIGVLASDTVVRIWCSLITIRFWIPGTA